MSGQLQTQSTYMENMPRSAAIGGTLASWGMLALGYQSTFAEATHPTIVNVSGFLLLQIIYVGTLWRLTRGQFSLSSQVTQGQALKLGILTALTLASSLFSITGLALDWLLYLVTIAAYVLFCPLRITLILIPLLCLLLGLLMVLSDHWNWSDAGTNWLYLLPTFGLVTCFLLMLRGFIVQKLRTEHLLRQLKQSNAELEQTHLQLQHYTQEVEELTIVRERTRLAREIHDTLGHYLALLNIQLGTMSKLYTRNPADLGVEIAEARQLARQAIHEVRNAVAALRPTSIATLSLPGALAQLGSEFAKSNKEIQLTLDLEELLPVISQDVQMAFYRAAQEALTNALKHAHANKVLLRLRYENSLLELVVLDNGTGGTNDGEPYTSGFGLTGLHERFDALGGQVTHGLSESGGYRFTAQLLVTPTSLAKEPGGVRV